MKKSAVLILVFLVFSGITLESQTIQLTVTQIDPLGVKAETTRMVEDLL